MNSIIIGLDEAGVGSLMGMMVAGAVILPSTYDTSKLFDSKTLSEKKRETLFEELLREADVGIGIVTNEEIDILGMAKCRRLVFHRALDDLDKGADKIIVDGTLFEKYKDIDYECIPKADKTVPCVSAASIIAKHYRDTKILEICDQEQEIAKKYDWRKNKGYPAPKHLSAIKEFGVVSHHRKSYRPCMV
tara:strand:+ start:877 stop:1446 length:570 start_codon:yes stop_codon:yes gene_type:complete